MEKLKIDRVKEEMFVLNKKQWHYIGGIFCCGGSTDRKIYFLFLIDKSRGNLI